MTRQQPTTLHTDSDTGASTPKSAIRRFFEGWKRLEQAMDYSPHDYAFDRLRSLESRIERLEKLIVTRSEQPLGANVGARNTPAQD